MCRIVSSSATSVSRGHAGKRTVRIERDEPREWIIMDNPQGHERNTGDDPAGKARDAADKAKQTGEEWADKAKHTGEEWAGKAKEAAGKMTDDERLEGEGKAEQAKGSLKKAGDKLKEAFRRS